MRLFTVGCSFTNHSYPTWADFLSSEFDQYENWGQGGYGNRAIFNRLVEIIYKRNITADDTIVVMWSTPVREDRWYKEGGWKALGNIYNQPFYSNEWVEKYFDPFMGMMETINYAFAAQQMLDNIGCKWTMAWSANMSDLSSIGMMESEKATAFLTLCDPDYTLKKYIDIVSSHDKMISVDLDTYKNQLGRQLNLPEQVIKDLGNGESHLDSHPNPVVGYHYAKNFVCPKLGISNFDPNNEKLELAQEWLSFLKEFPRTIREPKYVMSGKDKFDSKPMDCF
jgi:hypothetical protein